MTYSKQSPKRGEAVSDNTDAKTNKIYVCTRDQSHTTNDLLDMPSGQYCWCGGQYIEKK
jgi:hypothetical protein